MRSRAYDELRACPGRIERTSGTSVEAFRYVDLANVRFMEGCTELWTRDGRRLVVKDQVVAPRLAAVLQQAALPELADHYVQELKAGHTLAFREAVSPRILATLLQCALMVPLFFLLNLFVADPGTLHPASVIVALGVTGAVLVSAALALLKGGAIISATGVRRYRDPAHGETPWDRVKSTAVTPHGLHIESSESGTVTISHVAANFVAVALALAHFRPDLWGPAAEKADAEEV